MSHPLQEETEECSPCTTANENTSGCEEGKDRPVPPPQDEHLDGTSVQPANSCQDEEAGGDQIVDHSLLKSHEVTKTIVGHEAGDQVDDLSPCEPQKMLEAMVLPGKSPKSLGSGLKSI